MSHVISNQWVMSSRMSHVAPENSYCNHDSNNNCNVCFQMMCPDTLCSQNAFCEYSESDWHGYANWTLIMRPIYYCGHPATPLSILLWTYYWKTHINASCHIRMSHVTDTHIRMSHVTDTHIRMRHVMDDWVMSHLSSISGDAAAACGTHTHIYIYIYT